MRTGLMRSNGRLGALMVAPNATLCEQVKRVADSLMGDDGEPLRVTRAHPGHVHALAGIVGIVGIRIASGTNRGLPDVVVATPQRAAEDVLRVYQRRLAARVTSPPPRRT